jgi:cephalosporin hydroxylase
MSRSRIIAISLLSVISVFALASAAFFSDFSRRAVRSALAGPTTRLFHSFFYNSETTWANTYWLGTPILKLPLDLWIYQEIIVETRPDVIIEAGTLKGGSALFFASICDLIDHGRVVSIDIQDFQPPRHKRVRYLIGSSTSSEIVEQVKSAISPGDRVMVTLDSDHSMNHVLNELRIYSKLVTKDAYLVVEDTNLNGHPIQRKYGPGPMEAVHAFLKENHDFAIDHSKEKYLLTFFPDGWLRKLR